MKVWLRPPQGGKKDGIEVDINPDELIESVRKRVEDKHGIFLEGCKLLFKGVSIKDDSTLRSNGVYEGDIIIVQGEYHNKYMPMGVTPMMEKRKAEEVQDDDVAELEPDLKKIATFVAPENIFEAQVDWIHAYCATHGEKGMRRQMEDEHLICTSMREQCPDLPKERDFAVFALFDGHGGKQVAGFIKNNLAMELGNSFANDEPKEGPLSDKRLKKAVENACQRLDSRIATELAGCYDGCTANVVLVNEGQAICINLGDTMAYLCRQPPDDEDKQAIPLQMRQHKCWMMKEKERILRSGGAVENGRINGVLEVSRAFGDITLKKFGVLVTPEFMKFKVDRSKDEFILLGSDVFWNAWTAGEALEYTHDLVVTEEERAQREGDAVDLRSCCRDLVQHVIEEKKAQDNVSVVIVRFKKD
eukprot:TRINITY_DN63403_c0_g1_i1.p1 TRINITY_DN63403_c0_g1~~TRINITY_DN63403_c0_g1_i1.p1  ORF type:complete len:444 (-),score=135.12 TRINITY_DN63403_c0_g1_i1:171-1421(-)